MCIIRQVTKSYQIGVEAEVFHHVLSDLLVQDEGLGGREVVYLLRTGGIGGGLGGEGFRTGGGLGLDRVDGMEHCWGVQLVDDRLLPLLVRDLMLLRIDSPALDRFWRQFGSLLALVAEGDRPIGSGYDCRSLLEGAVLGDERFRLEDLLLGRAEGDDLPLRFGIGIGPAERQVGLLVDEVGGRIGAVGVARDLALGVGVQVLMGGPLEVCEFALGVQLAGVVLAVEAVLAGPADLQGTGLVEAVWGLSIVGGAIEFLEAHLMGTVLQTLVVLLSCLLDLALAALALALVEVAVLGLAVEETEDGLHGVVDGEAVGLDVEVELVDRLVEGEAVDDPLLPEVLAEVDVVVAGHRVRVLLDQVDQVLQHLSLRPLDLDRVRVDAAGSGLVVGVVLGEVGVHPDLDLALLAEEDHLLGDVEVPHLLVEDLEPLEAALVEVELVAEGDVVDLLEPQVDFLDVEQPVVDGGAEFGDGGVGEVLDLVDVGGGLVGRGLLAAEDLDLPAEPLLLPQLDVLRVAVEVLLVQELQLVLLDQFPRVLVDEQPLSVRVDVEEEGAGRVLDRLDPVAQLDVLASQRFATFLAHCDHAISGRLLLKIINCYPFNRRPSQGRKYPRGQQSETNQRLPPPFNDCP